MSNGFERDFLKLINNATFRETMGNTVWHQNQIIIQLNGFQKVH